MGSTPEVSQAKPVAWWKRLLVFGVGAGAGFALALVAVVGMVLWYESRPTPPKPWNTKAIVASFDRLDTEGQKSTIVLYYVLENTTNVDYRVDAKDNLRLMARLARQRSLSASDNVFERFDSPIFIPAKQRLRYAVHIDYAYPSGGTRRGASAEELQEYRKGLSEWVNREMSNLDGFVLFDEGNRYQTNFPKGW